MKTEDTKGLEQAQSRRTVLGVGALVAGAGLLSTLSTARAEDAKDHSAHASASSQHQALVEAAADCIRTGEVCVGHCAASLGKGETMLKDCMNTVLAMLPMCTALLRFASISSPRLKELAKLCHDVCADCEKECRKHEKHHEICKACAESCATCIKECKKLMDS